MRADRPYAGPMSTTLAIIKAHRATVNTLCYNPPVINAGPKRRERKAKPFIQTVLPAPPSLKMCNG
jgi:hypothetical protein